MTVLLKDPKDALWCSMASKNIYVVLSRIQRPSNGYQAKGEATGNSTKLICGYSIHVSSATINRQYFLAFRRLLSYRKKERSLLLINILKKIYLKKNYVVFQKIRVLQMAIK